MSCGNPHELDCQEALDHLYEYLDDEVDTEDHARIAQHLHECGPCLHEFDVERIVKKLVARSCCESAPAQLRGRLAAQFAAIRMSMRPPGDP